MLKADVELIATRFALRFATDPKVREKARAALRDPKNQDKKLAAIVNTHLKPKVKVTAADMKKIVAATNVHLEALPKNLTTFDGGGKGESLRAPK